MSTPLCPFRRLLPLSNLILLIVGSFIKVPKVFLIVVLLPWFLFGATSSTTLAIIAIATILLMASCRRLVPLPAIYPIIVITRLICTSALIWSSFVSMTTS